MFSEYASRFLAQSQSRISSFRQDSTSREDGDRPRGSVRASRFPPSSRSYLQRPGLSNHYAAAASNIVPFPFASRASTTPAPLFYSATDEFREEDDEAEREREVAEFYALQRSRRQFGASQLEDSSEVDENARSSELRDSGERGRGQARRGGIRSSWRGEDLEPVSPREDADDGDSSSSSSINNSRKIHDVGRVVSSGERARDTMFDVRLDTSVGSASTMGHSHVPSAADLDQDTQSPDDAPAFQQFRQSSMHTPSRFAHRAFLPYERPPEEVMERPRPGSSDRSSIPPSIDQPITDPPRHDPFWSSLFLLSLASLLATFFLVYLHTSVPSKGVLMGDTIYTTLRASFHLLAVDTVVAIVVSLLWLALLRSYIRPLIYTIMVAVPIVFMSFSIYPFVASFQGPYRGMALQDRLMRWLSILPALGALIWTYTVWRGRRSLHKATEMLEFGCRILGSNPALVVLGFATLMAVVVWTWVWMGMFTRVFLGGHVSSSSSSSSSSSREMTKKRLRFILDGSTWWLGAYFCFVYLWTLSVMSGIQRAATAATVSQWYFHRLAVSPSPASSQQVVLAALHHACTTSIGTVCFSSFLTLLVRLPFLLLPRRIVTILGLFFHSLLVVTSTSVHSSISILTHPLTLTHAAIHSSPLSHAAKSLLNQVSSIYPSHHHSLLLSTSFFFSAMLPSSSSSASMTTREGSFLPAYRLAKILLHATRFIMTIALGLGAWVNTARSSSSFEVGVGDDRNDDDPSRIHSRGGGGSLYGYVVGLIAAAIGWAVLGAIEGVLANVLDAAVLCWVSESRLLDDDDDDHHHHHRHLSDGDGGGSHHHNPRPRPGRPRRQGRYCLEANRLFGE